MQDLANHLHGATVFSKLDLIKGYHQVPVAEADKAKTAIMTPFGLFIYNFMPIGLRNAVQTFLQLEHLRQVFQIMEKCSLALNIAKSEFGQPTVTFLGHQVSIALRRWQPR